MAKIENKKAFANDILAQIELIKENWNENFMDVNYVIDHLVRNDVNLMDLDLYNSSANRDKQLIYDILLQPSKKKLKNGKLFETDSAGRSPPQSHQFLVETPKRLL